MHDEWPPLTKGPVSLFYLTDEAISSLDDRKPGDKYIFQFMIYLVLLVVLLSLKKAMNKNPGGVQFRLLQTIMDNFLNIYNIILMLIFVSLASMFLIYWYVFIISKDDDEEKKSTIPTFLSFQIGIETFVQWLSYLRSKPLRYVSIK